MRILIYLISLACGISLINSVIHLYPKYPKAYLKKYLKHIIVLNTLAILSMFYRYLNLFSTTPAVTFTDVQIALYSIIFTLGIIVTFLNFVTFLQVQIELLEWKKSRIFSILFLMGSIAPLTDESKRRMEHLGLTNEPYKSIQAESIRLLEEHMGVKVGAIVAIELGGSNTAGAIAAMPN